MPLQSTDNPVFASPRVSVPGSGVTYTNSDWVAIDASTPEAQVLTGVFLYPGIGSIFDGGDIECDVGVGEEGLEEVIATVPMIFSSDPGFYDYNHEVRLPIPVDLIPEGSRVSVRVRIGDTWTANNTIGYSYYKKPLTGTVFTTTVAPECAPTSVTLNGPVGMVTPAGTPWANSAYVTVIASAPSNLVIGGIYISPSDIGIAEYEVDIATGTDGNETVVTTYRNMTSADGGPSTLTFRIPLNRVTTGQRVAARFRCANPTNSMTGYLKLWYYRLTTTSTAMLTKQPVQWTTPAASGITLTDGGGGGGGAGDDFGAYGDWTEFIPDAPAALALTAFSIGPVSYSSVWGDIQFGSGQPGFEIPVATFDVVFTNSGNAGARHIELPIPVNFAQHARVCARTRSVTTAPFAYPVSLGYIENPDFQHRGSMAQSYEPLGIYPVALLANASAQTNSDIQELIASTSGFQYLGGITVVCNSGDHQDIDVDILIGAPGEETVIGTLPMLGTLGLIKPERARMMLPVLRPIPAGSRISYRFRQASTDAFSLYAHIWLIPGSDFDQFGTIGPLAWWHRRRRLPDGTVVSVPYSDWDMQCPEDWYEGFKESEVISFGDAERKASDPATGEITASTFRLQQSDAGRLLREELASTDDRYWVGNSPVYMTDRPTRAALGVAYCVFNGPIIDIQPTRAPNLIAGMPNGLAMDITLSDMVFRQLMTDQGMVPWRQLKDTNLKQFHEIAESLDREAPEPIIYGRHRRVPDVDPPSPEGFIFTPILLGKFDLGIGGGSPVNLWWCWEVCGHAVHGIPDAYVIDPAIGPHPSSILADEGTIWLVPHHGGFNAHFGAPYHEILSDTYGETWRVTRVYGKVGEADPDACAVGTKILALAIDGVESVGDSTGELLNDRFDIYRHFFVNYVANAGANSYKTGNWLDNPTWSLLEGEVTMLDEESIAACQTIAAVRLPASGSPVLPPYVGAGIIGAHAGDRLSVTQWLGMFNVSCGVRAGLNHFGQWTLGMLHPTQAIKDAAPLIEESNDILINSFDAPILTDQQANRQPFLADFEHTSGRWLTSGHADADSAIVNYGRPIPGDERQYRFAPGITMAYHLARMAVLEHQHPPRSVTLEGTIGADPTGFSLGYLDLFSYIRYRHFAGINDSAGQERLAWIIGHQVQAGRRVVRLQAIDVDDLIDFDLPAEGALGSPLNETCAMAIDVGDLSTIYNERFDTSTNATDASVVGSPPWLAGDGVAYHAAWFTFTAPADGVAVFSTLDSNYDTQLAVFSGSCGALLLEAFNDNYATLLTSFLSLSVTSGTQYFILACGKGPDDGGVLQFFANFEAT